MIKRIINSRIVFRVIYRFMSSLKPKRLIGVGLILSFVFSNSFISPLLPVKTAYAAPNYQINYQGKLTDSAGTAVADGTYQIVFKLYTASSGGTAIWTETYSGANKITVTSGLFSTMLGSLTSLSSVDFNQTLYLGVTVESDSEMTPRKILGAVPAAFQADKLDGLDSTDFISTSTAALTKVWSSTGLGQIGSSTATTTFLGNLAAVGTTVLNGILSVYQNVTAPYFTATSTSQASTFPYASTTAISATTASSSNLIASTAATFSFLGSGLTKVTSGVLSVATAGTDYLTSAYREWSLSGGYLTPTTTQVVKVDGLISTASSTFNGNLNIAGNATATNATTTNLAVTTEASTSQLTVSNSAKFTFLGSGLTKLTSGVLGLATAGTDYLTSTFKDWQLSGGYLTPTTTQTVKLNNGFVSTASSTVSGLLTLGSASSTALTVSGYINTPSIVSDSDVTISPTASFTVDNSTYVSLGTAAGGSFLLSGGSTSLTSSSGSIGLYPNSGVVDLHNSQGGATDGAKLAFWDSGSAVTRIYLDSSQGGVSYFNAGNVGVGTDTPYAKLSVVGQTVSLYFTATSTSQASTFPYASTTAISATTASSSNLIASTAATFSFLGSGITKVTNGVLSVATAGTDYLTSAFQSWQLSGGYLTPTTTQTVLLNNGFVSAASSTVSGSLTIAGSVSQSGALVITGAGSNLTMPTNGTISANTFQNISSNDMLMRVSNAQSFIIRTNDTERLKISSAGLVGIGTTTPYAKLSVVGQTVAEYFTATSTTQASTFPLASTTALTISGGGKSFNITDSTATSTIVGDVNIAGSTGVTIWTNEGNSAVAQGSLNIGSATPGNGLRVTRLGGTDSTFVRFIEAGGAFASFVDGTGIQLDMRDTGSNSRARIDTNGDSYISPASGNVYFIPAAGAVAVGTTTPPSTWAFQVASNKLPFVLTDTSAGTNLKHWTFASQGGLLYVSTSSDVYATSTIPALTMNTSGYLGLGTSTPGTQLSIGNTGNNTINLSTSATSTFGTGINIRGGCYAINGTCISGGSGSGTVGSGTTGQMPYYAANGTTLTATSTISLTAAGFFGVMNRGDVYTPQNTFQIFTGSSTEKTYTNTAFLEGLAINSYYNDNNSSLGTVDFVALRNSTADTGGSTIRFFTQPKTSGAPVLSMMIDKDQSIHSYQGIVAWGGRGINGGTTTATFPANLYISKGYTASDFGTIGSPGSGGTVSLAAGGDAVGLITPINGGDGNTVQLVFGGVPYSSGTYGNDGTVYVGNPLGKKNARLAVYGTTTVMFKGTATVNGVCHSRTSGTYTTDLDADDQTNTYDLVACSAAPNDIAEMYPTDGTVDAGSIVSTSNTKIEYMAQGADPFTGVVGNLGTSSISVLKKAVKGESGILGVISTGPYQTFGRDIQKVAGSNPKPVALVGRVPVKVNLEGGDINPGDRITLSSVPGVGMKASTSGMTIGVAISSFNANSPKDTDGVGKVYTFVNLSYAKLDSAVTNGNLADGLWTLDESTGRIKAFSSLDLNNMDINNVRSIQSGSGDWSISADGILVVKEVRTQKLCLGQICITETDLKSLLDHAGLGAVITAPSGDTGGSTGSTTPPTGGDSGGSGSSNPPTDPPASDPTPTEPPPSDAPPAETPPAEAPPTGGDTPPPASDPAPSPAPDPAPAPAPDPTPAPAADPPPATP